MPSAWLGIVLAVSLGLAACGGSVTTPAVSPSLSSAPSSSTAQSLTLTIDGQTRTYLLFKPHPLDPTQRVPLVIAIHGYTVDAAWMETTTRFDEKAKQGGFVVVYPEGINNSWNAGSCCGDAQSNKVDDVLFVRQLISSLVANGGIDPKRVFVTGMSNGGMMAHRLACELSDRIAAIASVSGALVTDTCNPGRPISVLEMHGTGDAIVPYDGGFINRLGQLPATMSFMTHWARLNGCAADPVVTQTGITKTSTWRGCSEGSIVVLDAISGASHSWFGPDDALRGEPNATQVTWDFFSQVPPR